MIIALDRDYEVKCTLGTIKDIEGLFKKPFMQTMSELNNLTTTEQIKLLYAGVKRANQGISESEFFTRCDEHMGLGELNGYLEEFVYAIQYPDKTKEEAQQIIEKKLIAAEKLKTATGMI